MEDLMDWDAVGAIAEAAGAVGVMLTLIYLALQTKQNSRVLEQTVRVHETNAARANSDGVMNLQSVLAQDHDLAWIWKKGLAGEDLQEPELARFEAYLNMFLFDLEYKLYLSNVGEFDELGGAEVLTRHIEGQIPHLMRSRHARQWWVENSVRTFGPVFVDAINRIAEG